MIALFFEKKLLKYLYNDINFRYNGQKGSFRICLNQLLDSEYLDAVVMITFFSNYTNLEKN